VDSPFDLTHAEELIPTGERTMPGLPDEEYWFARHEAAYGWVRDRIPSGVVLDAGVGEGYGAAALSGDGRRVIALDYDPTTCAHIRARYPGVAVARANLAALPLTSRSVDAVVCFQVVEHLWDLRGFLNACRRVLRRNGELFVTTPNRLTFSPGLPRGAKPLNPFHVEEFDADQMVAMLREAGFWSVDVRGVHHGPRLQAWERDHGGLVAAQVSAAVSGHWAPHLRRMVASVTAADFTIDGDPLRLDHPGARGAQDLLLTGRAPS
jgi:SAM-dependent methyltransferase